MTDRTVHRFVDQQKPYFDDFMGKTIEPEQSGFLITVGDGTIATMAGVKRTGVSKNGKKWSRWSNPSVNVFSMRSGKFRVYHIDKGNRRSGRSRTFQDVTSARSSLGGWAGDWRMPESKEVFKTEFFKLTGVHLDQDNRRLWGGGARWMRDQMLPGLALNRQWEPIQGIPGAMRATTGRDMIVAELGVSRYRKDLVKALADSSRLEGLKIAKALRKDFPVDWLVPLIAWPTTQEYASDAADQFAPFLLRLPPRQQRLLIADLPNVRAQWVFDTLRMGHREQNIPRLYTWNELHDELIPLDRRNIQRAANRDIPQEGPSAKLDGLTFDGMELRSAKTTGELVDWGNEMHHCIGGYGSEAVRGTSHLFGLYSEGKLYANLELTPKATVRQFYGKYNADPDEKVRAATLKAIEKKWKEKVKA